MTRGAVDGELRKMIHRNMARTALGLETNFENLMLVAEACELLNLVIDFGQSRVLGHFADMIFLHAAPGDCRIYVAAEPDTEIVIKGEGKDQEFVFNGLTLEVWRNGVWHMHGPWVELIEDFLAKMYQDVSIALIKGNFPNSAESEARSIGQSVVAVKMWMERYKLKRGKEWTT